MIYRNAAEAFSAKLAELMSTGSDIRVRGSLTKELNHQTVVLTTPLERCIVIPHRRNNVFATIVESVWVIAGRNDLQLLTPYLPRAVDFSDDGSTWRAGYGPRLRNWHGVDQVAAVERILQASPESRQGVLSLFDPALDFVSSKDIPCTNWLHFIIRNGALDLNVAVRSNDIVWGFSGINTFEWSILQEMMAFWLGAAVGKTTYHISSLHLYERHFERARRILEAAPSSNPYDQAPPRARFSTAIEDLPLVLDSWFQVESKIRSGAVTRDEIASFPDPLLRDFLRVLHYYWTRQRTPSAHPESLLSNVEDAALASAAINHFRTEQPGNLGFRATFSSSDEPAATRSVSSAG